VHPESVDKAAFMVFLKGLLPNLEVGSILVLDNWTVHPGADIKELVESYQCKLRYLPSYSPDFNPIELVFSKIKAFIKALRPRETPNLIQAFQDALFTITTDDILNSFSHCGYNLLSF
jgi:transposase